MFALPALPISLASESRNCSIIAVAQRAECKCSSTTQSTPWRSVHAAVSSISKPNFKATAAKTQSYNSTQLHFTATHKATMLRSNLDFRAAARKSIACRVKLRIQSHNYDLQKQKTSMQSRDCKQECNVIENSELQQSKKSAAMLSTHPSNEQQACPTTQQDAWHVTATQANLTTAQHKHFMNVLSINCRV